MDHQPHRTRHIDHQPRERSDDHGQHRVLDLDAEVFGDHLAAVLDLIGMPSAGSVVDLGAGTGAGSQLLRERYPDAVVTCVDKDPQMLELLREQGFAVVAADVDDGFPALAGPSITADVVTEPPVDLRGRTGAAVPRRRRAGTPRHPDRLGGHPRPEPGAALSHGSRCEWEIGDGIFCQSFRWSRAAMHQLPFRGHKPRSHASTLPKPPRLGATRMLLLAGRGPRNTVRGFRVPKSRVPKSRFAAGGVPADRPGSR